MEVSTQAVNQLAGTLSNQLITDGHTGNLVASPLGLVTILSMILAGSKSRTHEQLTQVLNIKSNQVESLHKSFENILTTLNRKPDQANDERNIMERIANGEAKPFTGYDLYTKSVAFASDMITDDYMSFVNKAYKAQIEMGSKTLNKEEMMDKVNNWVNESTHGKIEKILDNPPNPNSKLILVNSVYFSGKWSHSFKHVSKGKFLNNGIEPKTVEMMSTTATFDVGADKVNGEDVTLVELPYVGSASMVIILPESSKGVNKVLKGNIDNVISRFDENKESTTATVKLPKFSVDSSLDLIETISALGASDLVDDVKADLSGMTGENVGLYMSQMKQKTQIDANEHGTVAASSTVAEFSVRGLLIPDLEFVADKPFAFVIRDTISGAILFVGKIAKL